MKKLISFILCLFMLVGCYSDEEKQQMKQYQNQASTNAINYIEHKYGITPKVKKAKNVMGSDGSFTGYITDEVIVEMTYQNKDFTVSIDGSKESMSGYDDYQKDEIYNDIKKIITSKIKQPVDIYIDYNDKCRIQDKYTGDLKILSYLNIRIDTSSSLKPIINASLYNVIPASYYIYRLDPSFKLKEGFYDEYDLDEYVPYIKESYIDSNYKIYNYNKKDNFYYSSEHSIRFIPSTFKGDIKEFNGRGMADAMIDGPTYDIEFNDDFIICLNKDGKDKGVGLTYMKDGKRQYRVYSFFKNEDTNMYTCHIQNIDDTSDVQIVFLKEK